MQGDLWIGQGHGHNLVVAGSGKLPSGPEDNTTIRHEKPERRSIRQRPASCPRMGATLNFFCREL
jgi:hypothetical protein